MNDRLGRGLSALIPDNDAPEIPKAALNTLPIDSITPNRYQPRKHFDAVKLTELADSIRENGIIQPLIVTKTAHSGYELIAGERRLQAAKLAGFTEVPVVIRSVSKKEQLQLAIIENIQREDLNPIEEALAYQALAEDFELSHAQIAQIMSKDRATISNSIRLLKLSDEIRDLIASELLSPGHARAVLSIEAEYHAAFVDFILKYKLTVRQAEEKSKTFAQTSETPARKSPKSHLLRTMEVDLRNRLKAKTTIRDKAGKGKIILEYNSPQEFEALFKKLSES
ncbi:MAG: chromosome partitioning protein ParB [Candidatus Cloacimonetes bacterium HGW-Cloacimonetes-1]|jgi:ParB family chromosome partitioning protein|nr:MAG: chromosome partitioning protein ParB [Candidatus Cloacimonetes bacterium HGW-Cloacimonetes-1]